MKTHAQLTAEEKDVAKTQALDKVLLRLGTTQQLVLEDEEAQAIYNDVYNQNTREGTSTYTLVTRAWSNPKLRAAIIALATKEAQAVRYRLPGEVEEPVELLHIPIDVPVPAPSPPEEPTT